MSSINVQFSDSTESEIVSYFAGPQDAESFPNQAVIDVGDPRYAGFYSNLPYFAQANLPVPAKP